MAIQPRRLGPVRLGRTLSEITLGSPATDRHPARKEEVIWLARRAAHTTVLYACVGESLDERGRAHFALRRPEHRSFGPTF
jgi:hypothetical protein